MFIEILMLYLITSHYITGKISSPMAEAVNISPRVRIIMIIAQNLYYIIAVFTLEFHSGFNL